MIVLKSFRFASLLVGLLVCVNPVAIAGGLYPTLEASFTVTNLSSDPFDYAVSDIRVQIQQPDATILALPAFFDGGQTWRVRHSPTLRGLHQIRGVTLNGQPLTVTSLQPANWMVSGMPSSRGFVTIDPSNTNRFMTSDGRRFFPLGNNVAWDVNSATNVVGILAKMGAAHENWSRIWMNYWDGKNLDWPSVGSLGTLSLTVARKWDAIVAAAEQGGISFQMTLHHHGEYSSTVDPNWPQNPYNVANGGFLSDATRFFTNSTAKALTKRKLRYGIARWGCSPAVMAWELFNEVQYTDAAQKGQWTNVAAWHNEMAQFIRAQDPYHHLITTSSQLDQPIWSQCDYYQHHDYPIDLISALRDAPGIPAGQPAKPIFGGECGMDSNPVLGIQAPLWAGLMAGQSGAAQQWYWDHIDADNCYSLFNSAQSFVFASGLGDQDVLTKSAPHVTCDVNGALVFSPGGGWANAIQTTFTIGDSAPNGIGTLPSFLQGAYHKTPMNMPNGYTFLVNYAQPGTFSVQVLQIALSGASLVVTVDNSATNRIDWPAMGADTSTNYTLSVNVPSGLHTIRLTNPGQDWVTLGNISLDPYTPVLGAYQVGNSNFAALWIWHRTNIYNVSASSPISGIFALAGLQQGTYAGTWWDTLAGALLTNFSFTVGAAGAVTIATPPILRSAAFFAGPPARAAVIAPSLTQTLSSNSPSLILPLTITNGGGLPLAYSLMITGASPVIYRALDSIQPVGPVFAWKDISGIGHEITGDFSPLTGKPGRDEGMAGPIDIGFTFPFFSGSQTPDLFSQLYVSPNGFISFAPFTGDTSTNRSFPNTSAPGNCIAVFWDDLDLSGGGHIYTAADSLTGDFTLQYQDVPLKGTGAKVTCQLILKTSGEMVLQYKTVGIANACTVGLQDASQSHGLQVACNQPYLQNALAVRISPTPWFSLARNAEFVPGGSTENIDVSFDPGLISSGTWSATLVVKTADPALPAVVLPVILTVLEPREQWRLSHFGTVANTGVAADDADPDNDGIVNLVEYALGLDPNSPDREPVTSSVVAGHLTLTYIRPHPAPADVVYIPEVSGTLVSGQWNSGPLYTTQLAVDNGDGAETVTVTDLVTLPSAMVHYLRVRFAP